MEQTPADEFCEHNSRPLRAREHFVDKELSIQDLQNFGHLLHHESYYNTAYLANPKVAIKLRQIPQRT